MTNQDQNEIVAKAAWDFLWRRYVIGLALIVAGPWFGYDGWKGWPEANQKLEQANRDLEIAQKDNDTAKISALSDIQKQYKHHGDFDIQIQKILACSLPPLGILFLGWSLYKSRGAYRLREMTLSVPGHPEIQLDDITRIDKQKWDRKGVAYLHYKNEKSGKSGVIKLDDMVYNRRPTDEILGRIEGYLIPAEKKAQA